MSAKRLRIAFDKEYRITAWSATGVGTDNNMLVITELEGWDTKPSSSGNKSKTLFGQGEIVSPTKIVNGRLIDVTINATFPSEVDVRAIRETIMVLGDNESLTQKIDMTYYNDAGEEYFRQVLDVKLGDDFFDVWDQVGNTVTFNLQFFAPDPRYTVYLNGSVAPEAKKRY